MRLKTTVTALLSFALVVSVFADADGDELGFKTIRQKAMGGTAVANAMNESALMNNPAGLWYAPLKIKAPRVRYDFNQDTVDNLDNFEKLQDKSRSAVEKLELLETMVPLKISNRQYLNPGLSFTWRGIGVGLFSEANFSGDLYARNGTTTTLDLSGYADVVPAVGIAQKLPIFDGTVLGASLKMINRGRIYNKTTGDDDFHLESVEIVSFINDKPDKEEPGFMKLDGFSVDVGLLNAFKSKFLGEGYWGLSVQNIGAELSGTKELKSSGNLDVVETIPVVAQVGVSFKKDFTHVPFVGVAMGELLMAADYRFIAPDDDFAKNLHLGVEKSVLKDFVKLRGGINEGYIVGGVGINVRVWKFDLLQIDYAEYVDELGEKSGNRPERLQALQLSLLF